VIAVISSSPREASALSGLAASHARPTATCLTLAEFKQLVRKIPPALVLTRRELSDGYSDDILDWLAKSELLPSTPVIVLVPADCSPGQEARQLSLGAACVLRDPLRPAVLVEYSGRFLRKARPARPPDARFVLGDATIDPDQQAVMRGKRSAHLSPKEIELARLLAESSGRLVSYEQLYSAICGRKFSGDTVNIRVLFSKLASSFKLVRVDLRQFVQLIPKSGYRYSHPGA
jgi:DNA-binding response OmpR family regulator